MASRKKPMDYTDFDKSVAKPGDPATKAEHETEPGFWWKQDDPGTRAKQLADAAESLEKDQTIRHAMNLLHARLYGNFDMQGFGAREYMNGSTAAATKIAFNVVEAGTDTLAAKISKHRPRPQFLSNGAKWGEQQKARRLGHFSEGQFSYAKVYKKSDPVFVDSCVQGTGGFKVIMDDNGKVNVERAFVDEILVDEADAKYGEPRQMIQGKLCHREMVLACYADSKDKTLCKKIEDCKPPHSVEQNGFGDMIMVYEAWHLRSGKDAKDGCHVVCLDDGTELFYEPWNLDRFPFVFYRFKPKQLGFWGTGVAEILTGIQIELNRLVRSISEQLRRKGKGRVFMPLSSKVPADHMTNAIGDLVYFNGAVPPVVDNSNAVAQEEFMQIDRLYQKAFQLIGASELSVSAKKPSGLDAAVALREFEEIESERFAKQHQRWDEFFMELAETMLDFVREFGGKNYVTKYEHKRYMETIKWDDVKLEPGEYSIQMLPSSSLPTTPAARRQAVKELMMDGMVSKAVGLKLLDFPDLEAETNLGTAAIDDVDAMIDRILSEEEPEVEEPDQYSNLELVVERATAMYLYAKNHDADEKKLDALSRLIDLAAAKIVASQPPPMPAAGVGPGAGAPPPPIPGPPGPPGPLPGPMPAVPPNLPQG